MLMDIILYLLQIIQQLYKQNYWLINFICRYLPLKQPSCQTESVMAGMLHP